MRHQPRLHPLDPPTGDHHADGRPSGIGAGEDSNRIEARGYPEWPVARTNTMNPITALLFVAAWLWTTTMVLADETNRFKLGTPDEGYFMSTGTCRCAGQ